MRYCVKGRTQIKEDQNGLLTGISCNGKVICYLEQGGFCAVKWTDTGINGFIKAVVGEVSEFLGFWRLSVG